MILMLETKQRFVNTDYITTAYIEGREDRSQIKLELVNGDEITLPHYYRTFAEAEAALQELAKAISE